MMGVRIVLAEGEPIGLALRRFCKQVEQHRASWKWHKWAWRGPLYYVKPSKVRGVKDFMKKVKARAATHQAKLAGMQ